MIEPPSDLFSSPATLRTVGILGDSNEGAKLERVHPRPGIDYSAVYRVSPTRRIVLTMAAVAAESVAIEGTQLRWWPLEQDPLLPGLASAHDPTRVAKWLGWADADLKLVSYRPLRRAVLRATNKDRTAYLKVLTPSRATRLQQRHELLRDVAPNVIRAPEPGVLVVAAAQGASLADSFVAWHDNPQALPTPRSLRELLDAFPARVVNLRVRKPWTDSLDFYAAGAASTLPSAQSRIQMLASGVGALIRQLPRGPLVPTHGDFYEANVFVHAGRARQVIDLDSVGPGHRVDDYACLLGHAAVLPDLSPRHYRRLHEVVADWFQVFSQEVSPAALAARVSGVILTLMVGAPEHAAARLGLAETWQRRAEKL